jgi:hypothetical protein
MKKYTSDDIKILKANSFDLAMVDVSKGSFQRNLTAAVIHAIEFARQLVTDDLPDRIKYVLRLGSSYDSSALEEGEQTYPEDYSKPIRYFEKSEDVVNFLWRNGKVPEWINVSVDSKTAVHTNIKLECCGRFSNRIEHIYHAHEGRAPFHVLGPPVPQGFDLSSGKKYQL